MTLVSYAVTGCGVGDNDDFGDLHLLSSSPCIDVGDPNYSGDGNGIDIDGGPRVVGGRIDIGADEYISIVNFLDFAVFAESWMK